MNQFDFQAFFQQLNNTESLFFIAFCLGAFLLGIFLGLALRGGKVRRLKKELKKKEQELNLANTTIETQNQQVTQLEADLKKSAYDLNQIRIAADRYEKENNNLEKQVLQLKANLDKNQQTNVTYDATMEDLQNQIAILKAQNEDLQQGDGTSSTNTVQLSALQQQVNYLKTRNEQLQQEIEALQASTPGQEGSARVGVLEQQVTYLKQQNTELMERLALQTDPIAIDPDPNLGSNAENRLAAFEARLAQLEQENAALQSSIQNLNQSRSSSIIDPALSTEEPNPEIITPTKVDLFRTDRALLRDQVRDDLSRIDGVGPFIEKKLNDVNIYSYEQIASWSAEDIKQITQQIQYFEGRIEKDNWVGQAKILMESPSLAATDNEASSNQDTDSGNDDLKIVEGIGAKIENILKLAGINSLEQLAKADPADLRLILEQNESHFHMHDPTTWPAQARLAANGDWDVLEDYQDKLKGGREVDEEEED